MMGICSNRPEGLGPKSSLSAPLPTLCFIDTILLPLPIFLLPILLLASFLLAKTIFHPSTSPIRARPLRTCAFKTFAVIYYILIIANILMAILEIVRLSMIDFGIALLPVVLVGLLAGGALHFTNGVGRRIWKWQGINLMLWTGGMVFSIIKTVAMVLDGIEKRKNSKYPVEDQITDTAVMAGLYAVLIVLESVLWWWEGRRNPEEESLGSQSPVMEGSRSRYTFGEEFAGQEMK